LPLVALEMKIMSCADPVGLFCKFATPVTLVHAVFLAMRLCMYAKSETKDLVIAAVGFAGALVAVFKGYRQHWSCVFRCPGMLGLVGLAFLAAAATTYVDAYLNPYPQWKNTWDKLFFKAFETSNSYIEILAFVPAVWIVFTEGKASHWGESTEVTKRTSTVFFVFLVCFYLAEDLYNAYQVWDVFQAASVAHVVHFTLLLDFGIYVLAHIYNQDQLVGSLRKWLRHEGVHEV